MDTTSAGCDGGRLAEQQSARCRQCRWGDAQTWKEHIQEVLLSSVSIGGQGYDGAVDSACNSTVSGDAYATKIEDRCKELGIEEYIKKSPRWRFLVSVMVKSTVDGALDSACHGFQRRCLPHFLGNSGVYVAITDWKRRA